MLVFDLVRLMDPDVTPDNTKVHLAAWNGSEDPLQVYFQGEFDDWQSWQTQRNFDRPYVLSLIKMPEKDRWLYVGVYASGGFEILDDGQHFRYRLKPLPTCAELAGRLMANFVRPGRQSYLDADDHEQDMLLHELRPERIHMAEFPGFKKVDLAYRDLNILVRQNSTSWRVALSNVAGVYLVSDPEAGKLYVGSATRRRHLGAMEPIHPWQRRRRGIDERDCRTGRRARAPVPLFDPGNRRHARQPGKTCRTAKRIGKACCCSMGTGIERGRRSAVLASTPDWSGKTTSASADPGVSPRGLALTLNRCRRRRINTCTVTVRSIICALSDAAPDRPVRLGASLSAMNSPSLSYRGGLDRVALAGIGLMLLGYFMFSLNDAMGKWLVTGYSVAQVMLVRSAGAFLLIAPALSRQPAGALWRLERPGAPGAARADGHARHHAVLRCDRLPAACRRDDLLHGRADLHGRAVAYVPGRAPERSTVDCHRAGIRRRGDRVATLIGRVFLDQPDCAGRQRVLFGVLDP
jgi:hypothetical protein